MGELKPERRQAGITMIEVLMAGALLTITSLGMIGLIVGSIATNNRNKVDTTQTMLAQSILEQIHSTFNGVGTSALVDCSGINLAIDTTIPNTGSVGADLLSGVIDWSQASPPAGYHMDYVIRTPCTTSGTLQGTYDVRWHLDQVTGTNSYLITVGAKLKRVGGGNSQMLFSPPVNLRFMAGS